MDEASAVPDSLAKRVFGVASVTDDATVVSRRVREGLSGNVVREVQERLGLSQASLARMLGVTPRTLQRKASAHARIGAEASDRAARLIRIFDRAVAVHGNGDRARAWLRTPVPALGGEAPLGWLDTDAGSRGGASRAGPHRARCVQLDSVVTTAWRLCSSRWAATAFDGEGARRHGGRWNTVGTPLVYTSESRALAMLEVVVNTSSVTPPLDYVALRVEVPESQILVMDAGRLPPGWRRHPAPSALARIGDAWAKAGLSLALAVPSAVVPAETNLLLNPLHPAFGALETGAPEPVSFDTRLFGTR